MESANLKKWFKILKAKNGEQALKIIDNHDVDIIVSDVMMPVMDGLELCQRVKDNIEYSHIPVILLTAKTLPESKTEGFCHGADAYVEKPFTDVIAIMYANKELAEATPFLAETYTTVG